MNIRTWKTGDKILLVSLISIAALFMVWNSLGARQEDHLTAVITQNGQLVQQIQLSDLSGPEYIYLKAGFNQVILAEKGRIRFLESDCPNQTCVKTGWLTKPGDKAVCIPSQAVIKIVGSDPPVDILAY